MTDNKNNKSKHCPECSFPLKEVYAEANYGRVLLLDQCENCGGIWFDRWELYHLKDSEADRLDAFDKAKLLTPASFKKETHLCPKCNIALEHFKDTNLPKDANIERCRSCSGLWLNRGELAKYKNHRLEIRKTQKPVPAAAVMPSLEGGKDRLETLKNLGNALSTDISLDSLEAQDDSDIDSKELAKDLVFLIVQTLLRMFLKI